MMQTSDNALSSYDALLASKAHTSGQAGFEPLWLPGFLRGFQASLDEWAICRGRAVIAADCGLGKTPISLVWAENVVRHTNRPVLVLQPGCLPEPPGREGAGPRGRPR
jgi:hypothetical protein